MRTQKPISTISYNTPFFLREKLDNMVKDNVIGFYAFICHKGELRKSGERDKDHIHLYVEPSKILNTDAFKTQFNELVSVNDKPLGCMPFRPTKTFDEWLLYNLHQEDYIRFKGEEKEYLNYNLLEVCTSDRTDLECRYDDALDWLDLTLKNDLGYILKTTFPTPPIVLLEQGKIKPKAFHTYNEIYTAKTVHEHAKRANDEMIERAEKYTNLERSHSMRFDLLDSDVRVVQDTFNFDNLT